MPVMIAASPVELGEHVAQDPQRAARRDLRDQIARLERELALTLAGCFPRREPARGGKSASAQAGPRLLGLEQLECIRDELVDRVSLLHANPARSCSSRCARRPGATAGRRSRAATSASRAAASGRCGRDSVSSAC